MKIIEINADQIERAENRFSFKVLNGSFTNGEGNDIGALGEIMVFDFFSNNGYTVIDESTYDYDFIINGYKVDVKTKKTSVKPEGHSNCSVADYNTTQKCDYYFFVRINEEKKECYLLGHKSKKEFYEQCFFAKKGEIDYGKPFPVDCHNLQIDNIDKFKFDK